MISDSRCAALSGLFVFEVSPIPNSSLTVILSLVGAAYQNMYCNTRNTASETPAQKMGRFIIGRWPSLGIWVAP